MASSTTLSSLSLECSKCHQLEDETHKLQRCGACKVHFYCGLECQKSHWSEHKTVCKLWKTVSESTAHWKPLDADAGLLKKCYPAVQQLKDVWDTFNEEQRGTCPHALLMNYLFKGEKAGKAADLGCGIGFQAGLLLAMGFEVTAVDVSLKGLEILQKKCKKQRNRLTIQHCEIAKANFEKMDVIVANDVLPYTNPSELHQLLNKVHRSLNSGGQFFGSFFVHTASEIQKQEMTLMGVWFVKDLSTAKKLLESLEFQTVSTAMRPASEGLTVDFHVRKK